MERDLSTRTLPSEVDACPEARSAGCSGNRCNRLPPLDQRAPPNATDSPDERIPAAPRILDKLLRSLRAAPTPIIPLRDVPAAVEEVSERPFVCFTLDDGYHDNWEIPWPSSGDRRFRSRYF
jgi:hypothetical protein